MQRIWEEILAIPEELTRANTVKPSMETKRGLQESQWTSE
jgi:hypothetical protein